MICSEDGAPDESLKEYRKRRFHAFCVGTPRSGTHSIANIFRDFRVTHEADQIFMIFLLKKKHRNEIFHDDIKRILKVRDNVNLLEMDSSHYNGSFIEEYSEVFPDAKYILTIRDCISWLDSWFNHQASNPRLSSDLIKDIGRSIYFDRNYTYTKHDEFLKKYKLFPVKSYLKYWHEHNSRVINSISNKYLLTLRTNDISDNTDIISSFLNIKMNEIDSYSSHEGKANKHHNILRDIDPSYLYDIAMEVCNEINDKYFPDMPIYKSINDIHQREIINV